MKDNTIIAEIAIISLQQTNRQIKVICCYQIFVCILAFVVYRMPI